MTIKKDPIEDLFNPLEKENGAAGNADDQMPDSTPKKGIMARFAKNAEIARQRKKQKKIEEAETVAEAEAELELVMAHEDEQPSTKLAAPDNTNTNPPITLKAWSINHREAPNEALRCALFTPRNRNIPRTSYKNQPIAAYGSARVSYTGEELRQDDLDVWLQVIHMARDRPLGSPISFKANEMKKALKWAYGKKSTERLKTHLTRLQANAVMFQSERLKKGVSLSLVNKFEFDDSEDDKNSQWVIEINPDIAKLFGGGLYSTRMEWEQRLEIKGELAKWLHGFYASHREPHDISIDLLLTTSGSNVRDKHKAKQLFQAAHEELVRVNFFKEYMMTPEGKFRVKRTNTGLKKPE